ncbi:MAG TPA: lanthionine synthetase LanC family protein [Gemmatimonadales bacterium]|jgi:serine/threonine-protein kinase|nr:lanthionine synthetase LanC family protein [Gemmatimonadales bacterium]
MPITDLLILPVDVTITPVKQLAASVRVRLKARRGEYALMRPRGRAGAKIVSATGAALLAEFREASRVSEAVVRYANRQGGDPELLLTEAFPLLHDCFKGRFLVPANSPDAARILPSRERGDRIGRFAVLRCLQVLDDTELYQARGPGGALAAVKLARPGSAGETAGMLTREAAALRHLNGSGHPRFLACGRHRGRPWLATSWCHGVPAHVAFSELRERSDPASHHSLLRLARSVVRAYARLHQRGILHGDVHPKNLLIGRRGEVTILDFGLAEAMSPRRLSGRATRGGVAAYFPPEYARAQLEGRELPAPNPASEQYALGALLYYCFTGRAYADFPLERDATLRQILADPPLPFSARQAAPWPELESILARALSKQPAERYPSLAGLLQALHRVPDQDAERASAPAAPADSSKLVEAFLETAKWDGATFRRAAEGKIAPPVCSFEFGGAGVAYVLYRLACSRDAAELLALADAWLTRTEALTGTPTAFVAPGSELTAEGVGPVSPFHSGPGVPMVRALIALAMGDLRSARKAVAQFVELSRRPCEVIDLTLGRSGTLLGCALLLEALPVRTDATALALKTLGDDTLAWFWSLLDRSGPVDGSPELEDLGIAHGWAGLLYASLRWCKSARHRLPVGLEGRLAELAACAEPLGRGLHWPARNGAQNPKVWSEREIIGWCAGPAGFVHLWTLAHDRLRRPEYLALAEGSAWSTWDSRAALPDLCCGLAGRAYALLNFYKHSGGQVWLERARALADRAARIVSDSPRARLRPLSLFKGPLGVVALQGDLQRPESASMPLFEPEGWPDG